MIGNVHEFHEKFGFPRGDVDQLSDNLSNQDYRLKFLQEELNEFEDALVLKDRVAALDALLDLVYVAYGTALWMGISPAQWAAGMHAVHSANMSKVRVASADDSKRGNAFDCKKPAGWVGPEARLQEILSWKG